MDDLRTRLVVLFLGDPHLLESRKGGQDGSTNPYGVFTLRRSNDLDLHGGRSQVDEFLLETIGDTREHGGSSGENDVSVQVLTDIDIALHDGVVGGFVDTSGFTSEERRLEEGFRGSETLVSDGDDLTVRKFVGLLDGGGGGSGVHLSVEVEGDVAELLLDVTNDFTFGGGGEGVTSLGQDLHAVVGQITTSQIETGNGVREGITFIDGDGVAYTITNIEDDTGGTAGSVEGQDGLDGDVHGRDVEGLEHDLGHLLSVGLRVKRGLSQQDRVLLRGNTKLVVEGVMPDLLHVVPVGNDTVFNGVLQGEDTSLGLGFITDIGVLLSHTKRRVRKERRP